MKRERPVLVLVLALASLVVGGLGLFVAGIVQLVCWTFSGEGSPGTVVPLTPPLAEALRRSLPGFRAFELFLPGMGLLLAALILAAGLALLFGGRWARAAAMTAAGAVLLAIFAATIYDFLVVMPGIDRGREMGLRQNAGQFNAPGLVPAELHWVGPLLLIGGLILFVHAVAMLVILRAPAIAEAFQQRRKE